MSRARRAEIVAMPFFEQRAGRQVDQQSGEDVFSPNLPLPPCRGKLTRNADLARRVWFKCGGVADILFEPQDEDDLLAFLQQAPKMPLTTLGAGSNVLISADGIRGLVVILAANFAHKSIDDDGCITAGAALGDGALARFAHRNARVKGKDSNKSRTGLEFYAGIPGTIGGAVRMNAGAEGIETKDRLLDARVLDYRASQPVVRCLTRAELGFRYRGSAIEDGMVVLSARFATEPDDVAAVAERIAVIRTKRQRTQPITEKTGGSTFKNPVGEKAWRLIEKAGMRGARLGGAEVSNKHCNFLINRDNASSDDLRDLAEKVRARVASECGVTLEWEIVRLGWNEQRGGGGSMVNKTQDKLQDKPRDVLVILGGVSVEREVSCQTGAACAQALRARGYAVRIFDWRNRDARELLQAIEPPPDVVFNALHGAYGEDGCLHGLLECCAIPTTHSPIPASSLAMDKLMTKRLLQPLGIRFPASMKLNMKLGAKFGVAGAAAAEPAMPYSPPYIVKPIAQGSSVGVVRVLADNERPQLNCKFPLMIERYIPGREFTVGVFQPKNSPAQALGITEVVARGKGFYDYDAKYNKQFAAKHIFPAKIDASLAENLRNWSQIAHEGLGCRVISRCDFRYNPQEPKGENLYMLEINTHPGMTDMSLVPEQARGVGIDFEELIETLVLEAWTNRAMQRRQA